MYYSSYSLWHTAHVYLFLLFLLHLIVFSSLWFLIVHWPSLRGVFRIFCQFIGIHFSVVSYCTLISFLWWCHDSLTIREPYIFALVSVHLKKWSPLSVFTGLLRQGNPVKSEVQEGSLVASLGGEAFLSGSLTGRGHCPCSQARWGHWLDFRVEQVCWLGSSQAAVLTGLCI